jgi:hypothetical protein
MPETVVIACAVFRAQHQHTSDWTTFYLRKAIDTIFLGKLVQPLQKIPREAFLKKERYPSGGHIGVLKRTRNVVPENAMVQNQRFSVCS